MRLWSLEEFERFLVEHAEELGIEVVGRNEQGVMVFRIKKKPGEGRSTH